MKLIAIKYNEGYLITDNIKKETYFNSSIPKLFFDNERAENTHKKDWFKIKSKPKKVETLFKNSNTNHRFELRDKSLIGKFKEVYTNAEADDNEGFKKIIGLYEYKFDGGETVKEEVEVEWDEILEIETFGTPQGLSYRTAGQWNHQTYPNVIEDNVKYDILSEVLVPSVLLHTQPCKLSVKGSYNIIRKYIKENINLKVAEITSDYDFCFTVKKRIPLAKPFNKTVETIERKRKHQEIIYVTEKMVQVFEMAPAPYQSYTVIEPFKGDNQDDLKSNIDYFLENLISDINKPVCECITCGGTGVILK